MKHFILFITAILLIIYISNSQVKQDEIYRVTADDFIFQSGGVDMHSIHDCYKLDEQGNPLYNYDKLYIKVKKDVKLIGKSKDKPLGAAGVFFGIQSLDSICRKYRVTGIERAFRTSPVLNNKVKARVLASGAELPDLSAIYTVYIPKEQRIANVLRAFALDPNVVYAEPVPIMKPFAIPNDSLYNLCQHLKQIGAEEAWDFHKGENSKDTIIIGICDTGSEWFHPDLLKNLYQNLGEDADHDGHTIEFIDSVWVLDPGDLNGID
ncbi:MAG: hypothetical protein WCT77_08515, partial [Bacteroidota bacterium]